MNAKRVLYEAIKKRLLNETSIRHFALYNSQFDNLGDERLFQFPCVFMEFSDVTYETQAKGEQKGDTTIRLYVGMESIVTEDLQILDTLEEIYLALHGFNNDDTIRGADQFESPEDIFTPLNRVSETQDTNHDNIKVWVIDYNTILHDTGAHLNNRLTKTKASILDVTVDQDNYKPRLPHL